MVKGAKPQAYNKIIPFFALILIVFMVVALAFTKTTMVYANTPNAEISAQDQTVHRGQTFDVDVDVSNNTGLLTLFLTVQFDHDVFSLINVEQVTDALGELNLTQSGGNYDYIDNKTGGFNLFWDGGSPDSTNGTIVRLTFQSSLTAPTGDYPITLVVSDKNTTAGYNVPAQVDVTSPTITLIEGAYIVVWHNWDGTAVQNNNIVGHPYNALTGGYEYNSEDSLNAATDFPDNPTRPDDARYSYRFSGWEGAVWQGDVPTDSAVIYYVAKYTFIPKIYTVWYYVDGIEEGETPDGVIADDELFTAKSTAYDSYVDTNVIPRKDSYTFYGWFTDKNCTQKFIAVLMPAEDVKLYGYFKYNIRETDVPEIQLSYRETLTDENQDTIAYVDVIVTKNTKLSSLLLTLSDYDKTALTFCGYEFRYDVFGYNPYTTNHDGDVYPDNFNFSWNNSQVNTEALGSLLVLKFKVNPGAEEGAYRIAMTSDNHNTTYVNESGEEWYSEVEFVNTVIPIGSTNHWITPVASSGITVEAESTNSVPYNVELIVKIKSLEGIINDNSLKSILDKQVMVFSLFDIYFEQDGVKLTQEEYNRLFGDEKVVVKIKLTQLQLNNKQLDIYHVDDNGDLTLFESEVKDGYLVFETNHFSHWALVGDYSYTGGETLSSQLLRLSLIMFGLAVSGLIAILFVRNRRQHAFDNVSNEDRGGNRNI
jgi:uncharacterized repeat protein (TIGR02543 family)